jgi:peroxiredoxin Q/BCP
VLLGISVDPLELQQKFTQKHDFPYPLLADSEKKVAQEYGVLSKGGYANRTTFVIDKKGIVRKVDPMAKADKNAEEVLDWVRANLAEK